MFRGRVDGGSRGIVLRGTPPRRGVERMHSDVVRGVSSDYGGRVSSDYGGSDKSEYGGSLDNGRSRRDEEGTSDALEVRVFR